MFEQLFERPKALARQHAGPLVEERQAYLTHLAAQGTARWTLREIARYLVAVAESLRLAQRSGELITLAEVREHATLWVDLLRRRRTVPPSSAVRPRFIRFATAWLRFLGRLQLLARPVSPFDAWIAAFSDHLHRDAGVSEQTVRAHCRYALDFLQRRFRTLGVELPCCGPHALRHACAAHLLECGMSLREIGDHLGHQHPDSTRIYAKVDVAQLRRVADIDLGDLL